MSKIKEILFVLIQTALLVGVTLLAVIPFSCKLTESGIEIAGGDYSAPVLQEYTVLSEFSMELRFSEEVKIKQCVLSPALSGLSDSGESNGNQSLSVAIQAAIGSFDSIETNAFVSDDGCVVTFEFAQGTRVGKSYQLYGVVEDCIGNSLCFSVPFTGFNSFVPKVIMTELHTGMASQLTSEKSANVRRLEYVEFLALSDGNLAGLEFCSGYSGESKKFVFPPVEVKKGEIFLLHLRNWGNGCVNEDGDNLALASSTYSDDGIRDLWVDCSTKGIGDTTDIIILRNAVSNSVVDAVMYRAADVEIWSEKLKVDYSKNTDVCEIYGSGDVENATDSTGLSATKFLYRVNASEIYDLVMTGDELDYPVKVDSFSWAITGIATPGSL